MNRNGAPLYVAIGALLSAALGVWCLAAGYVPQSVFLAVGGLGFAVPILAKGWLRGAGVALGCSALLHGVLTVHASDTAAYEIVGGKLDVGWIPVYPSTLTRVPSGSSPAPPCAGPGATEFKAESPNQWLLLKRYVPLDRQKFPVAQLAFTVASSLGDESLAVAVEVGRDEHRPEHGRSLVQLKSRSATGSSPCAKFRIGLEEFGIGDAPLHGIRFLMAKPGTIMLDAVRLVPPESSAASKQPKLAFWKMLVMAYLVVGMSVQLPGVAWGHFLRLRQFRGVANADWPTKVVVGLVWLCFTAGVWPFAFLNRPTNLFTVELFAIGLMATILQYQFLPTSFAALTVIGCATLSVAAARRRGFRG